MAGVISCAQIRGLCKLLNERFGIILRIDRTNSDYLFCLFCSVLFQERGERGERREERGVPYVMFMRSHTEYVAGHRQGDQSGLSFVDLPGSFV